MPTSMRRHDTLTLTKDGPQGLKIHIPARLRDDFGLNAGDEIPCVMLDDRWIFFPVNKLPKDIRSISIDNIKPTEQFNNRSFPVDRRNRYKRYYLIRYLLGAYLQGTEKIQIKFIPGNQPHWSKITVEEFKSYIELYTIDQTTNSQMFVEATVENVKSGRNKLVTIFNIVNESFTHIHSMLGKLKSQNYPGMIESYMSLAMLYDSNRVTYYSLMRSAQTGKNSDPFGFMENARIMKIAWSLDSILRNAVQLGRWILNMVGILSWKDREELGTLYKNRMIPYKSEEFLSNLTDCVQEIMKTESTAYGPDDDYVLSSLRHNIMNCIVETPAYEGFSGAIEKQLMGDYLEKDRISSPNNILKLCMKCVNNILENNCPTKNKECSSWEMLATSRQINKFIRTAGSRPCEILTQLHSLQVGVRTMIENSNQDIFNEEVIFNEITDLIALASLAIDQVFSFYRDLEQILEELTMYCIQIEHRPLSERGKK